MRDQTSEDACGFEWLTKWTGRPPRVLALTPEAEQKLHKVINSDKSKSDVNMEVDDVADDEPKTTDDVIRL